MFQLSYAKESNDMEKRFALTQATIILSVKKTRKWTIYMTGQWLKNKSEKVKRDNKILTCCRQQYG